MTMANAKKSALVQVKQELARKYDRRAQQAGSSRKRRQFIFRAERYRRQAAELQKVGGL